MPNIGLANLTVSVVSGWSVVVDQYSQAPLQLHRPLYLDLDTYPTVFLKTPSSGLLGGDKHQITLKAAENATIKMLNQSATLIYTGQSEQTIEIDIEDGATVFFEPCPLILATGASFTQTVRISMSETSKLRYIDEWSAGRIAMKECFLFERFDNTIEIFVGGILKYRERFCLEPGKALPDHALVAGPYTSFKSVYTFGNWPVQSEAVPSALPEDQNQNSVAWRLKRPGGTIDRLLSRCALSMPSAAQAATD